MNSENEVIIQIRIAVAELKKELIFTEKALVLAHNNTIAWVMGGCAITGVIVAILTKILFIK